MLVMSGCLFHIFGPGLIYVDHVWVDIGMHRLGTTMCFKVGTMVSTNGLSINELRIMDCASIGPFGCVILLACLIQC